MGSSDIPETGSLNPQVYRAQSCVAGRETEKGIIAGAFTHLVVLL